MSGIVIEDEAWRRIFADEQLRRARSRLSLHEIRLIVQHVRDAAKPSESRDTSLLVADARQALYDAVVDGDASELRSACGYAFKVMGEAMDALTRLASADTPPKGGDSTKIESPFMSGAVPPEEAADAQTQSSPSERQS